MYRPGKSNGNADLMSSSSLPTCSADDSNPAFPLTDSDEIEDHEVGARVARSARLREPLASNLSGLDALDPRVVASVGEREHRIAPFTTDEETIRIWPVIQDDRDIKRSWSTEKLPIFYIRDGTPLVDPNPRLVSGQLDSGLALHGTVATSTSWTDCGSRRKVKVNSRIRGHLVGC